MSKKIIILLTMLILVLVACGKSSDNKISGEIISMYRYEKTIQMEIKTDDSKHYALEMREDTDLVWKEECILQQHKEAMDKFNEQVKEMVLDERDLLDAHLYVTIVLGEKTGNKLLLSNGYMEDIQVIEAITVTGASDEYRCGLFVEAAKPVIYLYPEEETKISVDLDYAGKLTCTYPEYNDGWEVVAAPDGTLTDENGQTYNYLYWEGISDAAYDFSEGYCVAGEDTAAFLEHALAKLGLNRREANEFMVYWLPFMQENPYNIISFQTDVYTEVAKLKVNPEPDTLIRVFMAWQSADDFVEISEQELIAPERTGFTVVEWGGAEIQ